MSHALIVIPGNSSSDATSCSDRGFCRWPCSPTAAQHDIRQPNDVAHFIRYTLPFLWRLIKCYWRSACLIPGTTDCGIKPAATAISALGMRHSFHESMWKMHLPVKRASVRQDRGRRQGKRLPRQVIIKNAGKSRRGVIKSVCHVLVFLTACAHVGSAMIRSQWPAGAHCPAAPDGVNCHCHPLHSDEQSRRG